MPTPEVKENKRPISQDEIDYRQATTMTDRHLANRLKKLARRSPNNMIATWTIVLSAMFENSQIQRKDMFLR